jgi:hypothetical protein
MKELGSGGGGKQKEDCYTSQLHGSVLSVVLYYLFTYSLAWTHDGMVHLFVGSEAGNGHGLGRVGLGDWFWWFEVVDRVGCGNGRAGK